MVRGNGRLKLVENESRKKNVGAVVINGRREMKSMNMAALAQFAPLLLRPPVIDRTGVSGYYDFPFDFTQEDSGRDSTPRFLLLSPTLV